MNINTDLGFTWVCAIFCAVFLIGVVMLDQLKTKKEISTEQHSTEQVITETDLYRMICTEVKDGVCMAYSVKRIVKE